ncbi:MAG TPA: DUF72 domain-containing protein [Chthoniobacterales bacterium]|nr:DUF72 domain-containing protein [Chthoniobacterales bacterium]
MIGGSEHQTTEPGRILVGTASWADPGFIERWYPKGMPAADRLPWYAQHFEMVEVNSTFYSVPDPRMVERWIHSTPDEFTFDVKLHQLLSRHSTAAKMLPPALQRKAEVDGKGKVQLTPEIEEAVARDFLRAVDQLRASGKLGVLLLQLSPAFSPRKHQLGELRPLLELLSGHQVAVEFRNRNWAQGERLHEMLEFLRTHSAALVSVDAPAKEHFTIMPPELDEITNPEIAYLRLHGRDAHAYTTGKTVAARFNYDYSDEEIREIAERSKKLAKKAPQAHIVFNNNTHDYAPHAALRLRAALKQIAKAPPRQAELSL